jgi:hypothetical protein
VSGEAFKQIESSLDLAKGGDIVLSGRAWSELKDKSPWRSKHVGDGNVCITAANIGVVKVVYILFMKIANTL